MKRRATLVALSPQLVTVIEAADRTGRRVKRGENGKPAPALPPAPEA